MRSLLAAVLQQAIFIMFQATADTAHGWQALVGAWALVMLFTWVQERSVTWRLVQSVVQTLCFLTLLGVFHTEIVTV
jgi:hypothetical protein